MKPAVEALLAAHVPLWVCEACGKGRNVGPDNWVETATYKTMAEYIAALLTMEKSPNF
jgi:uncharacterized protein involved in oxidation of intracellular sulfur